MKFICLFKNLIIKKDFFTKSHVDPGRLWGENKIMNNPMYMP